MKKFLAVAAVLAVSSVNAQELKFGDLNYFLKQGQNQLSADLNLSTEEFKVGGAKTEVDGYFTQATYRHGLTDKLNIFVGVDYLFDVDTKNNAAATTETNGFQNPKLGADFRVMDQGNAGFNLDVGAVGRVKLMDREVGDDENNLAWPLASNYSDPRSSLEVNARLGKKWNEANEFYLLAGFEHNFEGEYENSGTDIEFDPSTDFKFGGFYQYRPVNEFMMTFGLVGTRFGEIEETTSDTTYDAHMDWQFTFTAKYLITESFIGRFNFAQDRRAEYDMENTEIEDRRAKYFGVGVDWLF